MGRTHTKKAIFLPFSSVEDTFSRFSIFELSFSFDISYVFLRAFFWEVPQILVMVCRG
jgi:hypothetical protein